MRVAYTSDIHVDISKGNARILPLLADRVSALAPDVFVLAGDAANDLAGLQIALRAFAGVSAPKLFVPGNHDVWVESNRAIRRGEDSWHKYTKAIPDLCRAHGFHPLTESAFNLGSVAFVGSIGWYDYSLADERLRDELRPRDYDKGSFTLLSGERMMWNDIQLAAWLENPTAGDWRLRRARLRNYEVASRHRELLRSQLASVEKAKTIVCVLHMNPFAECLQRKETPDPFDAYEGSAELGKLLAQVAAQKSTFCICGHRHKPLDIVVDGVRVLRSPVGYLSDKEEDLASLAEERVGILEIPD